jgi:Tol biopolymer transport system component
MKRLTVVVVLSIGAAFLASGCLWGVVRDPGTGDGLPGVTVRYTDSQRQSQSTTTGEGGLYVFDQASGPVPAAGPVTFQLSAPGYPSLTETRLIQYNDNPNPTLENLSSFWESQYFVLEPARITFATDRDGNFEIYAMNADGSGQTRLTRNVASDYGPAWSPDRSRIAFHSDRDGNAEIYVMNANGSGQTNVTNNPAYDNYPAWSPDGSKIAFRSARDGNNDIYVMDADGTDQDRLTSSAAIDRCPDW